MTAFSPRTQISRDYNVKSHKYELIFNNTRLNHKLESINI